MVDFLVAADGLEGRERQIVGDRYAAELLVVDQTSREVGALLVEVAVRVLDVLAFGFMLARLRVLGTEQDRKIIGDLPQRL